MRPAACPDCVTAPYLCECGQLRALAVGLAASVLGQPPVFVQLGLQGGGRTVQVATLLLQLPQAPAQRPRLLLLHPAFTQRSHSVHINSPLSAPASSSCTQRSHQQPHSVHINNPHSVHINSPLSAPFSSCTQRSYQQPTQRSQQSTQRSHQQPTQR